MKICSLFVILWVFAPNLGLHGPIWTPMGPLPNQSLLQPTILRLEVVHTGEPVAHFHTHLPRGVALQPLHFATPASSAERRWNEQEGRLTPKREGERLKSFLFEDDQAEDVRMLSEAIRERTGFSILNQDKSDLSSDFKLICVFCFMFTTLGLTTLSVQFGHGFAGAVSLMSEQS